jgi:transposase-like protein
MAGMSADEWAATRRGRAAAERSQEWHAAHAALVLSELVGRGLAEEDVIASDGAWVLYGVEGDRHRRAMSELAVQIGSPQPEPLFVVGRSRYWLYDDILAWLAPALARRWDRSYEMRRRDVTRRWARSHARRRPSSGPSRYGYRQGVRRLDDSILSQRRWGAVLGYQGKERVLQAVRDGGTVAEAALAHGVSKWTVSTWARHAGISRGGAHHRFTAGQRAEAVAAYAAGEASHRIAKRVGTTHNTILQWVRDAGVEVRPIGRRYDPAVKERVLQAIRDGASAHSVAVANGVDPSVVGNWARAAGVGRRIVQPRFSPEQKADAVAAYRSGETANRIAQRIGSQRNTVLQWVRAAGVEVRPSGPRRSSSPSSLTSS